MPDNVAQARALIAQALTLLGGGGSYSAPTGAPAAPSANYTPRPQTGSSMVMRMGRNKGKSLEQIAVEDFKYLTWVRDKMGRDESGYEDPKWAAENLKFRNEAHALIMAGPPAPAAYTPPAAPPAPTYTPENSPYAPQQQAMPAPAADYAEPPVPAPPVDQDIPF